MDIRNIAIIAHVDHGKTTLVDAMLKQTHTFRDNQAEMGQTTILDRNDQERERGITILAKNTAVMYGNTKINIIDTPGHADFSGEVERVINMADGALLIIDAAEGPLPQTQFVLQKALDQNLPIIVVVNKIDRKDARPAEVLSMTEDLFLKLATMEEQLFFKVMYAVGRDGKVWNELPANFEAPGDVTPLFEEIIRTIPAPKADAHKPFKMLISTLDFDAYKGSYAIGKVTQGTISTGKRLLLMDEAKQIGAFNVTHVFSSLGLERQEIKESLPGDIIALTGASEFVIGSTAVDPIDPIGYPRISLTEPTLKMSIAPNTSPFAGREGEFGTARQLEQRLEQEKKTNIGMRIELSQSGQGFMVYGRGELHLSVLIESLRREGFEMEVGKPEVLFKEIDGVISEPYEEVTIDVDKEYMGVIIEEMGKRKGEMLDTSNNEQGMTRLVYRISSRNLLGLRSDLVTKTRGSMLFSSQLVGYFPKGDVAPKVRSGALIAYERGTATRYALESMQERGVSFIPPGVEVYEGMIIGLNNRGEDMDFNVCKTKKLTNTRSANADFTTHLDAHQELSLEQSLDFLEDDELLEVTPQSLRLRKRHLDRVTRLRNTRRTA
jgi:GTP-binding protein